MTPAKHTDSLTEVQTNAFIWVRGDDDDDDDDGDDAADDDDVGDGDSDCDG